MSEYISGSPQAQAEFTNQLTQLHGIRSLVIIGGVARAAMFETFGYRGVPPLALEYRYLSDPQELGKRDIDGVMPYGQADERLVVGQGEHPVDLTLNRLFAHPGGYRIGFPERSFPVDPATLEPRTRTLGGAPVRTFALGTHFCVEQFLRFPGENSRIGIARDQFAQFIAAVRSDHPEEFLPDEAYEPFIRFNPLVVPPSRAG